jgi:integrase
MSKRYTKSYKYGQVRLWKRIDSGIWYIFYKHPDTLKNIERSTKTNDKREAEKVADQLNSQITNKKVGVADGSISLEKLFNNYIEAKKPVLKPETIKRLTSSKHNLQRWLKANHPKVTKVKQITSELVRKYHIWRVDVKNVSHRTADNDIANLHSIFLWGVKEKLVDDSPFNYSRKGRVQLYKKPAPERDTYTVEEFDALVGASTGIITDLLTVLANTGMRFGECSHLKADYLDWNATIPTIEIRARKDFTPKDANEVKLIPMTPEVQKVLKRRVKDATKGGYLFATRNENPINGNHSLGRLKKLFPLVGIDASRKLYWHSLRNFFVLKCLDAGILPHRIMGWTGHDSVTMVLHYASARSKDSVGYEEFAKIYS